MQRNSSDDVWKLVEFAKDHGGLWGGFNKVIGQNC